MAWELLAGLALPGHVVGGGAPVHLPWESRAGTPGRTRAFDVPTPLLAPLGVGVTHPLEHAGGGCEPLRGYRPTP